MEQPRDERISDSTEEDEDRCAICLVEQSAELCCMDSWLDRSSECSLCMTYLIRRSETARATIGSPLSIRQRNAVCETLRLLAMIVDNLLGYLGHLSWIHWSIE